MACSVHENSVRDRPTSMPRFQPKAAGMTWNRSSAGTGPLELHHGEDHQPAPDPRPDNDEHETDVEERARGEGWIEGEEHRPSTGQDRRDRHGRADDAEGEANPGEGRIGQR